MAFRRIALSLLVVAAVAAACSSGEDAGISVEEPIGAPDDGAAEAAPINHAPSVIKDALVEMQVARDKLNAAAQDIVDLTTGPRIDGFLVSSVVDLERGYGYGKISVKVPSSRFEQVIGDLSSIGRITVQHLQGQDLSADFLQARASIATAEDRVASLLRQLEGTEDRAARFEIRQDISETKDDLARFEQNESYIEGQTAYSDIEVALDGTQPVGPPQKPVFERALGTATDISVAIGSGVVLAAGVVVPLGVVAVVLYLIGAPIFRRFRPRLET